MLFTGPTRSIITKIDEFLNKVSEAALILLPSVESYLQGDLEEYEVRVRQIEILEGQADTTSRDVETQMYTRSLIPENRGDVLGLLESTDNVIDTIKATLLLFSQETPTIPESLHSGFRNLAEACAQATESLVTAEHAFFRDVRMVHDLVHKVKFYEREADRISDHLKRSIFQTDLDLAEKIHLRYFATNVEKVSDAAEDASQRLSIYAIKRMV